MCALPEDAGQPFLPHPHHLHTVCFRGCLETVSGALQATPTCCSCSWHWPLPLLLQPLGWAPLPLPWATAAARHLATDALAPSSCPRTTSALWNPWGLLRAQSQQGYEPGTCFLFPQSSRANAGSRVDSEQPLSCLPPRHFSLRGRQQQAGSWPSFRARISLVTETQRLSAMAVKWNCSCLPNCLIKASVVPTPPQTPVDPSHAHHSPQPVSRRSSRLGDAGRGSVGLADVRAARGQGEQLLVRAQRMETLWASLATCPRTCSRWCSESTGNSMEEVPGLGALRVLAQIPQHLVSGSTQ